MTRWVLQYALLFIMGGAAAEGLIERLPAEMVQGPDGFGCLVIVLLSPFIAALSVAQAELTARTFGREYNLEQSVLLAHCGLPLALGTVLVSGFQALSTRHPTAVAVFGLSWMAGASLVGLIPIVRRIDREEATVAERSKASESDADASSGGSHPEDDVRH